MEDTKERLAKYILKGHFVLTSRLHSSDYLEKADLYKSDPELLDEICWEIASELSTKFSAFSGNKINAVTAPAPFGAVIAHLVACYLGKFYQDKVMPLFTEKGKNGHQVFKRGFDQDLKGKNVLVLDDILTTGGTIRQLINEVTVAGGNVLAVAVLCLRGELQAEDLYGLPLISVIDIPMKTWPEEKCPLCKKEALINLSVGKGAEFLVQHPEYPRE